MLQNVQAHTHTHAHTQTERESDREREWGREGEREKNKHVRYILCYKMYKTLHGMKHHTKVSPRLPSVSSNHTSHSIKQGHPQHTIKPHFHHITFRRLDEATFWWSQHVPLLLFTVYITCLCSLLLFTILRVHNMLQCYKTDFHLRHHCPQFSLLCRFLQSVMENWNKSTKQIALI